MVSSHMAPPAPSTSRSFSWRLGSALSLALLLGCSSSDDAAQGVDSGVGSSQGDAGGKTGIGSTSGVDAGSGGCVVTIEGELAGSYPCVVRRSLASENADGIDGFTIRVDARVQSPDDQVSVLIGCTAPGKLTPGTYHLSTKKRDPGCTAVIQLLSGMTAKRIFGPNETSGAVDARVDAITDTSAHGEVTRGELNEVPAVTMTPPTLHFRVTF